MMINLLNEIADILNKYNIRLNDVKIIFDGELLKHDQLFEKLNVEYDNGFIILKNRKKIMETIMFPIYV